MSDANALPAFDDIPFSKLTFIYDWQTGTPGTLAVIRHPTMGMIAGIIATGPNYKGVSESQFCLMNNSKGRLLSREMLSNTPALALTASYELVLTTVCMEYPNGASMTHGDLYAVETNDGKDAIGMAAYAAHESIGNQRVLILSGPELGLVVGVKTYFHIGKIDVRRVGDLAKPQV